MDGARASRSPASSLPCTAPSCVLEAVIALRRRKRFHPLHYGHFRDLVLYVAVSCWPSAQCCWLWLRAGRGDWAVRCCHSPCSQDALSSPRCTTPSWCAGTASAGMQSCPACCWSSLLAGRGGAAQPSARREPCGMRIAECPWGSWHSGGIRCGVSGYFADAETPGLGLRFGATLPMHVGWSPCPAVAQFYMLPALQRVLPVLYCMTCCRSSLSADKGDVVPRGFCRPLHEHDCFCVFFFLPRCFDQEACKAAGSQRYTASLPSTLDRCGRGRRQQQAWRDDLNVVPLFPPLCSHT